VIALARVSSTVLPLTATAVTALLLPPVVTVKALAAAVVADSAPS
jgi:hypothetical protein